MKRNGPVFWFFWSITFVFIVGTTYYYFLGYLPNKRPDYYYNEEEYIANAHRNNFVLGAKIILNSAIKQYTYELDNNTLKKPNIKLNGSESPNAFCYTLLETGIVSAASFRGHVLVEMKEDADSVFYLYLSNPDFHVKYVTLTNLDNKNSIINETAAADIDKCPTGVINLNQ